MMHELQSAGVERSACHGRRHRRACALRAGLMATLVALTAGNMAWADPPPSVEITPNAILKPDDSMEIVIKGPPRARMHLFILSNCDNDWETPEITPRAGCNPLIWRHRFDLDGTGDWKRRWRMTRIPREYYGQPLWLRVSLNQDARWPYGDALFTMVSEPCSVWNTFVDRFSRNECNAELRPILQPEESIINPEPKLALGPHLSAPSPESSARMQQLRGRMLRQRSSVQQLPDSTLQQRGSVQQLLDSTLQQRGSTLQLRDSTLQQRGSDERPAATLEVRHLVRDDRTGTWGEPTSVPGTGGATGVAWADAHNLFVTVGRVEEDVRAAIEESSRIASPGFYRLDITTGKRKLLLKAREDESLTAPFAVRPDYTVFVRERVAASHDGTVATLAVWRRGRIIREFPLRRTIHQILAAEPEQPSVLAYSRWQGVPALLRIDLHTGAVTHLGFPLELFFAVTRAPGDTHTAAAVADRIGHDGRMLIWWTSRGIGPGSGPWDLAGCRCQPGGLAAWSSSISASPSDIRRRHEGVRGQCRARHASSAMRSCSCHAPASSIDPQSGLERLSRGVSSAELPRGWAWRPPSTSARKIP